MNSRERDSLDWLFGKFLHVYAEAPAPADAWSAIERRLRPPIRTGWDWRGWVLRLASARGVGLDILLTPPHVIYGRELSGGGMPSPFISVMATQVFSLKSVA